MTADWSDMDTKWIRTFVQEFHDSQALEDNYALSIYLSMQRRNFGSWTGDFHYIFGGLSAKVTVLIQQKTVCSARVVNKANREPGSQRPGRVISVHNVEH